jgi:hypothetical protein
MLSDYVLLGRAGFGYSESMADTLYERDFHAWALEQAEALRDGRPIDAANLAEELESLGKSQRTYLVNNIAVLIAHRLKWDHQPERRSRSWLLSMQEHRTRVSFHMVDNPSLQSLMVTVLERAYDLAVSQAARETGLRKNAFPIECPYSWDDLLRALPEEDAV